MPFHHEGPHEYLAMSILSDPNELAHLRSPAVLAHHDQSALSRLSCVL